MRINYYSNHTQRLAMQGRTLELKCQLGELLSAAKWVRSAWPNRALLALVFAPLCGWNSWALVLCKARLSCGWRWEVKKNVAVEREVWETEGRCSSSRWRWLQWSYRWTFQGPFEESIFDCQIKNSVVEYLMCAKKKKRNRRECFT